MNDIEKLLKKAKKKLGDKQAVYYYGVEYSSDSKPDFRARIIPTKKGVQAVVMAGDSWTDLEKKIEEYIKGSSPISLAKDYLNHEISVHEQAISFNRKMLRDYEKLDEN